MEHRKFHEMIDACRPGSEDIDLSEMSPLADQIAADPELRNRYERTQRLDARLVRAIDDVEVPAGLRERLVARLADNRGQGPGVRGQELMQSAAERVGNEAAAPVAEAEVRPAPATRRRWLVSIAAVAASLLLLVAGYAFWPRHTALTYDGLLNRSTAWFEQLQSKPGWQPLAPGEGIRDFPSSDAIRARPLHWMDASSLVGQPACAYDLPTSGGSKAALFVIPADGQIAGSALPLKPASSTGGLMIGCWQSGEIVYVLVVEGNEWDYRRLLYDAAAPPLANLQARRAANAICCKLSPVCPVD